MRTLTLMLILAAGPAAATDARTSALELCRSAIVAHERNAPPAARARFRAIEQTVARIQEEEGRPRLMNVQAQQTYRSFRAGKTVPFERGNTLTNKGWLVESFCRQYEEGPP